MSEPVDWEIPARARPKPQDFGIDLERTLSAVLSLHARIPEEAFTASTLGTDRSGNGVVISGDGLVLTIGYLITEAEEVWLFSTDGKATPAHVVGYDQETGFGLVQALGRLNLPPIEIGSTRSLHEHDRVVIAGSGGLRRALQAEVVAKREFAGYWEYVLDEAIFTSPAHPNWGGTGLIDPSGRLAGVGSLYLRYGGDKEDGRDGNMIVPIDLLPPILDDLLKFGRRRKPPRPWLGLYATEVEDKLVIAGLAGGGPAEQADLRVGDLVLDVGGELVGNLAGLFRRIWARGDAGVEIPLTVVRDGRSVAVSVRSADRASFLRSPRLH
jgi:S1-C subfamily serine protease